MKFHFVFPYYDASPLSASSYRTILYASLPFKRQYLLTCECNHHTIAAYSPVSACLLYKKTCLLFFYELPKYSEISRKDIKEVDRPCSFTDSVQKNSLWNASCSIFIAIKQVVEAFLCFLHVFLLRQYCLYEHLHSKKALCLALYLPDILKKDTRYLYCFQILMPMVDQFYI